MSAANAEEVKKHVRVYLIVFAALTVLTAVTVMVSYLHLPVHTAVIVALIIASVKGSLVAGYFMHLISEERIIYWVLGLTGAFFIVLMLLPVFTSG
jgi:cytochrome c oxidase subunit 4